MKWPFPPLEIKWIISSVFIFNLSHNRPSQQLGNDALPAITSLCLPQQVFSSGEKAGKTTWQLISLFVVIQIEFLLSIFTEQLTLHGRLKKTIVLNNF